MFANKVVDSHMIEMSVGKEFIKVSFNNNEKIIVFRTLFNSHATPNCMQYVGRWFNGRKDIAVIDTEQAHLKIIDTKIPLDSHKTLKFYVKREEEKSEGDCFYFYHFWPKNIRKLHRIQQELGTKIQVDKVAYSILRGKGAFNQRLMVPICSTHYAYDHKWLYSVSLIKQDHYIQEVKEVNHFVMALEKYLVDHPHLAPHVQGLALPHFTKQQDLQLTQSLLSSPVAVHTKMLNGNGGDLMQFTRTENVKYQIGEIRQAYEGLLLLIAAGFVHLDIKPQNIVKNDTGFLLIDFGLIRRIQQRATFFSLSGSLAYMCPEKCYQIFKLQSGFLFNKVNQFENDIYGFCLSFIFPYFKIAHADLIPDYFSKCCESSTLCDSFYQEINRKYRAEDPMKQVLKKMFHFCLYLWIKLAIFLEQMPSSAYEELPSQSTALFLHDLAQLLKVSNQELIDQAVLSVQSLESELENVSLG